MLSRSDDSTPRGRADCRETSDGDVKKRHDLLSLLVDACRWHVKTAKKIESTEASSTREGINPFSFNLCRPLKQKSETASQYSMAKEGVYYEMVSYYDDVDDVFASETHIISSISPMSLSDIGLPYVRID